MKLHFLYLPKHASRVQLHVWWVILSSYFCLLVAIFSLLWGPIFLFWRPVFLRTVTSVSLCLNLRTCRLASIVRLDFSLSNRTKGGWLMLHVKLTLELICRQFIWNVFRYLTMMEIQSFYFIAIVSDFENWCFGGALFFGMVSRGLFLMVMLLGRSWARTVEASMDTWRAQ